MKRIVCAVAVVFGLSLIGLGIASAASATPTTVSNKMAGCHGDWYVNADEIALKPTEGKDGFVFDGPSLLHHATIPVVLKDVPTNGHVLAKTTIGTAPLFKMETTAPYSTINRTHDGKWWSSKVVSGAGSQASPMDHIADLVGKGPYTADTKVTTFGVGYANDMGNKATVFSVTFGWDSRKRPVTYSFKPCAPSASPSQSPSATSSRSAGASPSVSGSAAPSLPVTGPPVGLMVAGGAGIALIGTVVLLKTRRRKVKFTA